MAKTEDSIGMFDEIRAYRMQKADGKTSVIERTVEEMEFSEACEALVKADRKFRKLDVMVKLNPWTDAGAWFDALEERYRLFSDYLARVTSIPDYYIRATVKEAAQFGLTPGEAQALEDFLKARRGTVSTLISQNKAAFPRIVNWRVL